MATLTTLKRPFLTRLRSLRVANYYVKPKKKRGPSGQAWAALAGVTTAIVGTGVYLLGECCSYVHVVLTHNLHTMPSTSL